MNEKLSDKDFFISSDFPLLAAAYTAGYVVQVSNRSDPGRTVFSVQKDEFWDQFITEYFSRQLRVEPMAFAQAQKILKTMIYHI